MKYLWLWIVVVMYLTGLGGWIYYRFFRRKGMSSLKVNESQQLVLEQGGQKVTIDYDKAKNKVVVEFTDGGMSFRVIDGHFYETVKDKLPTKGELMSAAPTPDEELEEQEDDKEIVVDKDAGADDDIMKELTKARGSGVSKM